MVNYQQKENYIKTKKRKEKKNKNVYIHIKNKKKKNKKVKKEQQKNNKKSSTCCSQDWDIKQVKYPHGLSSCETQTMEGKNTCKWVASKHQITMTIKFKMNIIVWLIESSLSLSRLPTQSQLMMPCRHVVTGQTNISTTTKLCVPHDKWGNTINPEKYIYQSSKYHNLTEPLEVDQ